jgi:hypothetical protein
MQDDEITTRLRRLGEAPVPTDVAEAHLAAMAGARPQRRLGRVALIAAAAVAVLVLATVPTGLIGSSDGDHTDLATDVREAEGADGDEDHGRGRGPCAGPPPWAGRPPAGATEAEREESRGAAVEAWRAQRAAGDCPHDRDGEGRRPPWAGPRGDRVPCWGPPPWAGQPPDGETDEERAADREAQVREWHEAQTACRTARAAERGEVGERHRHGGPFRERGPCQGPPPWAGGPPAGGTEEEREANRQAKVDAWRTEREAAGCPTDED